MFQLVIKVPSAILESLLVTHRGYTHKFCFGVLCRCFYLAKSYSSVSKRAEAYALFCYARSLADSALQELANSPHKVRYCANIYMIIKKW